MLRRTFFRNFLSGLGISIAAPASKAASVVIQESPIAGFQFHDGEAVWPLLRPGDTLELVRETSNEHDANAVAIYRGDAQLGYVPRAENLTIAQMMDRGEHLVARVSHLREHDDPWARVRVTILLA